jgi:hypothetical protein
MDRLNIIKEFFRTAQQFLKLEKVEIGGLRGKALSNRIICVHEEFKVCAKNSLNDNILAVGKWEMGKVNTAYNAMFNKVKNEGLRGKALSNRIICVHEELNV